MRILFSISRFLIIAEPQKLSIFPKWSRVHYTELCSQKDVLLLLEYEVALNTILFSQIYNASAKATVVNL